MCQSIQKSEKEDFVSLEKITSRDGLDESMYEKYFAKNSIFEI